jgi:formylglycine-generating enzyme
MRWMIPLFVFFCHSALALAAVVDSDGDGVNDYREVKDGTDPNSAESFNSLSKGLMVFYPFDNGLVDESGFGKDLDQALSYELVGDLTSTTGNAFRLPSSASTGALSTQNSGVDSNTPRTVSFWFYSEKSHPYPDGGAVRLAGNVILIDNGRGVIDVDNNYRNVETAPISQLNGIVYHFVWTYEERLGNSRLYINGKRVNTVFRGGFGDPSQTLSSARTDSPVKLGGSTGFQGSLDDIRLYERALTEEEVALLHRQEVGNLDSDADGYGDGVEIDFGTDPNDRISVPADAAISLAVGRTTVEVVQGSYTWNQARTDAVNRGGRLAVFPTGDVYDRTAAKIRSTFSGYFWLGGSDAEQEGVWRWIDGTPITYGRWQSNEPNNQSGVEHALHVVVGNTIWNDAPMNGEGGWNHAYALEKRSLSLLSLPFVAQGAQWSVDYSTAHDDFSSAKAQTTDGQSTYREYTVTGPAVVDFWWKVSSQQGADYFSYSLNGVSQEAISGEVNWTSRTVILPAGTHTIRWTYNKDGSGSVGQDAGWLDDLRVRYLPPTGDEDNDGLNNTEELNLGTNPYQRDTDNDGVNDLREVGDGTNPLDPASFNSLNLGLVAYYPLNGNANDASGNGFHGTNFGGVANEDRDGSADSALHFNGVNAYAEYPKYGVSGARTVSGWVRLDETQQKEAVILGQMHVAGAPPHERWHFTTDRLSFVVFYHQKDYIDNGGIWGLITSAAGSRWRQYVAVMDPNSPNALKVTLYVDGKEIGKVSNRVPEELDAPYQSMRLLGGDSLTDVYFYQGGLDDLRVYNRALNAGEVASLFASEKYSGAGLGGAATKSPFDPATAVNWSAGGTEWSVDTSVSHDGVDSVKAQTTDGQSTFREYTVTGPAVVDFWWKVSSEELYDTFSYSVNGVNQQTISGEVDWTYRTLTLPAGTHTIRWTYTKDGSDAVGQDAGWLDDFAVYPATPALRVRDGSTVLNGAVTVDFGDSDIGSAGFTKSLNLANEGYVPQEVELSLPASSPFTFEGGSSTYSTLIGRGENVNVPIYLATQSTGTKTALLSISALNSTAAPPQVTLTGDVRGPVIGISLGSTTLTSGQTVDMGLAPKTLEFTIRNNGNTGNLTPQVSVTGNFQIVQPPATSIAPQASTTFKVLAQSGVFGPQTGSVVVTSNDGFTPTFTIALTSKALLGIGSGISDGTVATSGTGGASGWDFASTQLPSGSLGQAIKTGTTPNNGGSALEMVAQSAGVVSWSWKVSAQENFDWLLCEVDGQEVAGISTKNGVWQTQVVQVPAGSNVRWIYRKDASASAGEDAGYLADLEFRSATANQLFSQWADTHGILDPQQRLPKSGMRAKFAWLGGFDPAFSLTAGHHLPFMEGGRLKYRFPISKTADGTQQILFSGDMSAWTTRRFSQRVVSEDANRMVIEATAPSGTKGFFKVVGSGDTSMVWVEGGTLPQASELAGTTVATFQIGKTEVTWAEWQEVRSWAVANGYNLAGVGQGSGPNHPVRDISWFDAIKWCNAKSEMEGRTPVYWDSGEVYRTGNGEPAINSTADGYRLPTEAEWEWAARGGVKSQGYIYSGSNDADQVAWHADNSFGADENIWQGRGTWPVMQKIQNELGIYDMSGNVWECCWESNSGGYRHVRGGSWSMNQSNSTVSYLGFYRDPNVGGNRSYIGFRLARNAN